MTRSPSDLIVSNLPTIVIFLVVGVVQYLFKAISPKRDHEGMSLAAFVVWLLLAGLLTSFLYSGN